MARTGLVFLAIFFDLVTCILIAIGVMLLWPGTPLDVLWQLQPGREWMLMPYQDWLGPLFLVMALPAASASYGLFRRKAWARDLALAIFAAYGAGSLVQIVLGHTWEGALGVTVVGFLLFFLTSPGVRAALATQPAAAS